MSELVYENFQREARVKVYDHGDQYMIHCQGRNLFGRSLFQKTWIDKTDANLLLIGFIYIRRLANKHLDRMNEVTDVISRVFCNDASGLINHFYRNLSYSHVIELKNRLLNGSMNEMISALCDDTGPVEWKYAIIKNKMAIAMNEVDRSFEVAQ